MILPCLKRRKGLPINDPDRFVVDISSGSCHLVLLTQSGIAYTAGGYDGGQLGRIPDRYCNRQGDRDISE